LGGGYTLSGGGNSILYIQNTSSPVIDGVSGIYDLMLGDNSQLFFRGGSVQMIDVGDNALIELTGGQINVINGYYFFPADSSHITVYCQSGWTYQNGYLSGLWQDNTAFNIKLVTKSGSDIFSNMTVIPEPATMLLLGIGGLLLKRR
jgi:hypothetical protein